ncbi:MAG: hypothetical protein VX793_14610 [Pseudomonadota bacterium]|nr:hypothetical protein [Pseudomonadota bacterium]
MAKGPKPMRNWAAMDPLMRKGGAHQPPRQATRPRMDRRQALDEFDDWQDNGIAGDDAGPEGPVWYAAVAEFAGKPAR